MKKVLGPVLLLMMFAPTLAAAPKGVVIQSPPSADIVQLEGFCSGNCFDPYAEIDWTNETTDKVLVVTDLVFSTGSHIGVTDNVNRLRVSVTVWDPPCDYDNDASENRVSHMLLYVPPNDTRSLNLQTGLRVYPEQCLVIPLFEGAGGSSVTVMGRLEDL